jgi:hypothetical protein
VPLTNSDDYNRMTLFSLPFSKFFFGKNSKGITIYKHPDKRKRQKRKRKGKRKGTPVETLRTAGTALK